MFEDEPGKQEEAKNAPDRVSERREEPADGAGDGAENVAGEDDDEEARDQHGGELAGHGAGKKSSSSRYSRSASEAS